jgi:hypothetical protein
LSVPHAEIRKVQIDAAATEIIRCVNLDIPSPPQNNPHRFY